MLRSLHIRNYVLIDSLEIGFPEGLVIISGQTGAGKSILLGALSLLLGGKADQGVIGREDGNCVVEAGFDVPPTDIQLRNLLEENEVELEDGSLLIRRVVARTGRSRSFVNDVPVTVQTLQSIGSRLVDIHSQHQTLLLADRSFQLSVLDHFAGNSALLEECAGLYAEVRSLENEVSTTKARLDKLSAERDYNQARCKRLEDAHLREGELEELESEQVQLANAEEIKASLCAVEDLLSPSDPDGGRLPLSALLKEAQKQLSKAGKYIPAATGLSDRLDSVRAELDDILSDVSLFSSKTEFSEERLCAVEDRMSLLYDLMKAYSKTSIPELVAERDALARTLVDSTLLEERLVELERLLAARRDDYSVAASSLGEARRRSSAEFSAQVCALLRSLELEHSVFEVDIRPCAHSPSGTDSVTFLFSASGSTPVDVARCASGGEMSRLMLCLKAMMAKFVNMPTLVFDEIDTGVSGSVADKMGRMICAMGEDMQVFAITHLPQVAAKGDAHFLVEKEYDVIGTGASTSVRQISGRERVLEIARMLSGSQVTPAAVANAESLLGN